MESFRALFRIGSAGIGRGAACEVGSASTCAAGDWDKAEPVRPLSAATSAAASRSVATAIGDAGTEAVPSLGAGFLRSCRLSPIPAKGKAAAGARCRAVWIAAAEGLAGPRLETLAGDPRRDACRPAALRAPTCRPCRSRLSSLPSPGCGRWNAGSQDERWGKTLAASWAASAFRDSTRPAGLDPRSALRRPLRGPAAPGRDGIRFHSPAPEVNRDLPRAAECRRRYGPGGGAGGRAGLAAPSSDDCRGVHRACRSLWRA